MERNRHMADNGPILVTGAAGQLGAVGRTVCGLLLDRGLPVRAMVRREDDRAAAFRAAGAEVVVGDLLEPADVYRVVSGCRRVYFGMSVSAGYLEATVTMAVAAREVGVDAVVNMSQMTVSQMSIQNTTSSGQQRQHWLGRQGLPGSGPPGRHHRPARVPRPAGRHHPTDHVPGELFPSCRSDRACPRPHRGAVRTGQDVSGCGG